MGGKPSSTIVIKNLPIQPLPGSYGAPVRRKGHLTVYTDKEVVYVKLNPKMTIEQLKEYVKEKTGKLMKVYYKTIELVETQTLEELGIDEFAMIKATVETLDTESLLFSDYSSKSYKSYSMKEYSKASTPDSSKSLTNVNKLDIDLSVYAAPEVGLLKNKCKNRNNGLHEISEADD
ncbi:hypothetical protein SteCoe_18894 [Stentor coeruleus]|uniref:Ubiquitin-like domain-containing protein n=1 Tax=Stentor coeruleus TaxID=5963 RepID=A0A1R2BVM6_9CILI|nr:hypothetical protein SteCoe_18894 [Stentor coeruleus]